LEQERFVVLGTPVNGIDRWKVLADRKHQLRLSAFESTYLETVCDLNNGGRC
jgi:hypothetical protein